ncbi:NAD-dependent epimerase/dehydratase family protein [Cellulomonas gelida]|uniref:NAD-dependent epimerase/dehydratase family protein n=1 Tax=Cellulomonas gelida TaxID=1712 RepID=UPI00114514E2|nr:NAD-dependent epimerase/dehydratase family protein [Cellulomonas gelida]
MRGRPKALVLGGTTFVGIHLVTSLLRDGWDVTMFNRGRSNPGLFADVTHLRGDRNGDVSALADGRWDVVHDLSSFHPDQVRRSAAHLVGRCDHYVLVSTISTYANLAQPGTTEDAPLAAFDGPVPDEVDGDTYGGLKALCESAVAELFDSRTIVRPTIIAGPHDPTDRFTYWVQRPSTPGLHVAPPLDSPLQYVDARDLADWLVRLGAGRVPGTFNAATVPLPFGDLLQAVADETGIPSQPVVLTDEQREAEQVRPWVDLPLWLPPSDEKMRGMFQVDTSRAVAAGLTTRPLGETVRDTLAWARERGGDLKVGLSAERDAELAARYAPGR